MRSSKTQKLVSVFIRRFSLTPDKARDSDIDATLRAGVTMKGAKLWVLIFAILVASVGLNVNSIPVIIGAMLISPLMGPIMGIGYGVGIYDFTLIRRSFKNFLIAASISICASAIYFYLTPLVGQSQSEFLSRTTPTLWDVLIALFGGLAGIIDATRQERSNVTPGVAIATALMPPLCTAGYELVNGQWLAFGGAMYLFTINSVFIAFASAVVVRAFRVHKKEYIDKTMAARVKNLMSLIVFLTLVPSVYLAYNMVQQELFKANANRFVEAELSSVNTHVTQVRVDPKKKTIEVVVIGAFLSADRLNTIDQQMPYFNLMDAKLMVYQQNSQEPIDLSKLRDNLLSDLYHQGQLTLEKKNQEIQKLQDSLQAQEENQEKIKNIPAELHAMFPQISDVLISNAIRWDHTSGIESDHILVLNIKTNAPIATEDQARIQNWLDVRMKPTKVTMILEKSVKHKEENNIKNDGKNKTSNKKETRSKIKSDSKKEIGGKKEKKNKNELSKNIKKENQKTM